MLSEADSDEMSVCDWMESVGDPEINPGTCEFRKCNAEVWAA